MNLHLQKTIGKEKRKIIHEQRFFRERNYDIIFSKEKPFAVDGCSSREEVIVYVHNTN